MKLASGERRGGMRSIEAVMASEEPKPELPFDPDKEVLPAIWAQYSVFMNSKDPLDSFPERRHLILLSVLDSARLTSIRSHPKILDSLVRGLVQEYQAAQSLANASILFTEVAQFIQVFPELQERVEKQLKTSFEHLFPGVWRWILYTDFSSLNTWSATKIFQTCRAMKQLCPGKAPELQQHINRRVPWTAGFQILKEMCQDPTTTEDIPQVAADLLVYYPERKDEITRVIRPHWPQIKEAVQKLGLVAVGNEKLGQQYSNAIFGLALLSAKDIQVREHVVEFTVQEKRGVSKQIPLPPRSEN